MGFEKRSHETCSLNKLRMDLSIAPLDMTDPLDMTEPAPFIEMADPFSADGDGDGDEDGDSTFDVEIEDDEDDDSELEEGDLIESVHDLLGTTDDLFVEDDFADLDLEVSLSDAGDGFFLPPPRPGKLSLDKLDSDRED